MKNASNKQSLILASFLIPWMPNNNFTYRINTILVLGGCKKEEIDCFHKLGICSHANTMRNMQEKAASSFDNEVMERKNAIMNRANKISLFEEVLSSQLHSSPDCNDSMEICTVDFSVAVVSGLPHYSPLVYKSCKEMLPRSENGIELFEDSDILSALDILKGKTVQKFRIVGDNWDLEVKARCQTKTENNKSLHFFNSYAVEDRISLKGLNKIRPQKSIDALEMQEILPTSEVQEAIISDLAYIIPRVIVQHLPAYKAFSKAVLYHIPHPYSKEMLQRSKVVGINFIFSTVISCPL